jgi:hypothetical protein
MVVDWADTMEQAHSNSATRLVALKSRLQMDMNFPWA